MTRDAKTKLSFSAAPQFIFLPQELCAILELEEKVDLIKYVFYRSCYGQMLPNSIMMRRDRTIRK